MTPRQSGQRKKVFLEHFRVQGNISRTCRAIGLNRSTVYEWQETDDQFVHDFRQAEIEATETMEAEAYRRAVEGTAKPVFHQGAQCGTVQEYSDTLLIFMLKARNPAKYRERHDGAPDGQQAVKVVDRAAFEAL
jgi:hypothetical protein